MQTFRTRRSPFLAPACLALLALGTFGAPARAQDPTQEIQDIVNRIDEQMREIDRWLQESAQKGNAASKPRDLLERGQQQSGKVIEDIDELIQKLQQMRQQSKSQSQSQDQQQQQQQQQDQQQQQGQQQQGQQQQGNRQEGTNPDFMQQEQGQQQGQRQEGQQGQQEQPGQPQPQGQPDGPDQQQGPGENRQGNRPPGEGTEQVPPGAGDAAWGELQGYLNALKNRGSPPKVPERFRKYWEAHLKDQRDKTGGR